LVALLLKKSSIRADITQRGFYYSGENEKLQPPIWPMHGAVGWVDDDEEDEEEDEEE
jgi:hypothetical protein